jgi:outer membrane protein, heavy metal efflux system
MNSFGKLLSIAVAAGCIVAASGCRTTPPPALAPESSLITDRNLSLAGAPSINSSKRETNDANRTGRRNVQLAAYQDDRQRLKTDETSEMSNLQPLEYPYEDGTRSANQTPALLSTIEQFEQAALDANPAVADLAAQIAALQGKLTQAGLPPNPTVGINGSDINEDGGAGRYGVYFGRQIVRGNKLGLAQSAVCAEIDVAQQRLNEIQMRLLTDVRQRFYDLLVAQETVITAEQLVQISKNAADASQKLFEAQEAAKTSVLQSQLEYQNAQVVQRQAENQRIAARRRLAALLGEHDLPVENVVGDPRELAEINGFEDSFDQLVNSSPEIIALFAEVKQRRRVLAQECAQPIPDVTWQANLQFDTLSDRVISGFQIGMPIPILNQNQGAIQRARYDVVAAERQAEKKALDLRNRLANAYEAYLNAKMLVEAYDNEIIPKAKETLALVNTGYQQGEIDFLQLLTAQRTYSQLKLTYLQQLQIVWRQNIEIRGLLLSGSLSDP